MSDLSPKPTAAISSPTPGRRPPENPQLRAHSLSAGEEKLPWKMQHGRRQLSAALVAIAVILGQLAGALLARSADDSPAAKTVALIIDYGDGVQKQFTAVPWQVGNSILDALNFAKAHPRGIQFEYKGSGATALLTKIDDLKNEGRGRNWLYKVNGKLGDRSFATFELKAGDTVLWTFSEYR